MVHVAANEIVPVEGVLRQRLGPLRRDPQLGARQRLGIIHRIDALERDDRPPLLKPDFPNSTRRG